MTAKPCKYQDIGKRSQDLFVKNFTLGAVKFNLKSQSQAGSGFIIEAFNEIESGKVMGSGEFKNAFPGTNMNMSSKVVTINDKLFPGSRLGLLGKFDPKGGNMAGGVQAEYKNEFMLGVVEASLTGDGKPMLSPSFVFTSDGWLAGMHCYVDPNSRKVDQPQFTAGYETGNYSAFGLLNQRNELMGSLYQKAKETTFQYALNWALDGSHRLQMKINTRGQISAAVSKNFGSGISISLCGHLEGKNIKAGAHKIGMGIEMEL
ncbi:Voltage-dependent anion-selective channel protein 2 [Tyrophagus putrescentiae]|nr:Voltage-dependent anion-selective channel protein 2 [Tyrophagus putrescentiae]